jgi:hypothetical protein
MSNTIQFPYTFQMGGGGPGGLTIIDRAPITFLFNQSSTLDVRANAATSVTVLSSSNYTQNGNIYIQAGAASVIDISSIRPARLVLNITTKDFKFKMVDGSNADLFSLIHPTISSLTLSSFNDCVFIDIPSPNLKEIDFGNVVYPLSRCTYFSCTGASLSQDTIDNIVTCLDNNNMINGQLNISGGSNAHPTDDIAGAAAYGSFDCDLASNIILNQTFIKPRWRSIEYYFYFVVDGSGTDPGAGGNGIPVSVNSADTQADVAVALANAMLYNTSEYNNVSTIGAAVVYEVATQGTANDLVQSWDEFFTITNDVNGYPAQNSFIVSLLSKNWTINTN